MKKDIEKRLEVQMLQETGSTFNLDKLNVPKVLEKVEKAVGKGAGEGDVFATPVQKKSFFDLSVISEKISELLFSRKPKKIILPSKSVQRRRIRASIEREQSKLLREARKIQNARRFSAVALERVIAQIRHFQKLLEELVIVAVARLEQLYRQFVLKVG